MPPVANENNVNSGSRELLTLSQKFVSVKVKQRCSWKRRMTIARMSIECGLFWRAVKHSIGQEALEPEVSSPFVCNEYIQQNIQALHMLMYFKIIRLLQHVSACQPA